MGGFVVAVSRAAMHAPGKAPADTIVLVEGWGVEGDAHAGVTVQHRSRVARDPTQPNLRQVHLLHAERLDELQAAGFDVGPAEMGENVLTRGVDLLDLPTGALVRLGATAVVEVTGLRNPCAQLDSVRPGLMAANLDVVGGRVVRRKAGVMAVVRVGGEVRAGDEATVSMPARPWSPLVPV